MNESTISCIVINMIIKLIRQRKQSFVVKKL